MSCKGQPSLNPMELKCVEGHVLRCCMTKNPACPNCGRPMTFVREGPSSAMCRDPHVFECMGCLVVLMTEDHETLAGVAAR